MPTRSRLLLALLIVLGLAAPFLLRNAAPIGVAIDPAFAAGIADDPRAPASGPADAAVTIVLFADYRCSYCRSSHRALAAAVADAGDVRVVYKDWPVLGPPSRLAAETALAVARQGRYAAFHDRLMRDPRVPGEAMLRDNAVAVGADWAQVVRDRRVHASAIAAALARNAREAWSLGLEGTPAYLVGPRLVRGALDEAGFKSAIAAARG